MKTSLLCLLLVACTTAPTASPAQSERTFTDVTAANTSFNFGPVAPEVVGGRLVVRTDPDGSQTVEDFDVVLADVEVLPGVKLSDLNARLGVQADIANGMDADLLLDWDLLLADGTRYMMPTAKLRIHVEVGPDGSTSFNYTLPIMAGGFIPLTGVSAQTTP